MGERTYWNFKRKGFIMKKSTIDPVAIHITYEDGTILVANIDLKKRYWKQAMSYMFGDEYRSKFDWKPTVNDSEYFTKKKNILQRFLHI